MIISASRRTDIPAFYAEWFMNRIRAGYCTVPNPFNRQQISRIELNPATVETIVFWTRNPRPLFPYLAELEDLGYRFYFQYTLMANPREIDPKSPPMSYGIQTFQKLARQIGPKRVIWRYDPIVLSNQTSVDFHLAAYQQIAAALAGYTQRSVMSVMDVYNKARSRLMALESQGITIQDRQQWSSSELARLMIGLKRCADQHQYALYSCAEELELRSYGIMPGKCIDNELLKDLFGIQISATKDPAQREACGCVVSRDIGVYDTCPFGCQYCYATRSFETAQENYQQHDPQSPSLIGHYDMPAADDLPKQPRLL